MTDTIIYCLARKARANLCREASNNEPDLRRVLGHANVLDGLTAELLNLGYDWGDDIHIEDTATVGNKPLTPSGDVQSKSQVIGDSKIWTLGYSGLHEDYYHPNNSHNSTDSDDSDDSNNWDRFGDSDYSDDSDLSHRSDSTSDKSYEGCGNNDVDYEKYIYTATAQIPRACLPDCAVQVTVQEIK